MGYSKLATVKIWSPNHSGERSRKIDSVAIHTMAGDLSVEACGNLFAKSSTQASSNYGIGSDGRIAVYVDEKNRSWCTSSNGVDSRAVTIEVASTTAAEPFKCSSKAYEALITLLVDICSRNKIKALKWKGDKNYALSAANGGPVTDQNMFVHRWFENKSCPGEYLYSKQGQIANEVNKRLKNGVGDQTAKSSSSTSSTTSGLDLTIDYEKFNPYIITVDRNSTAIPYDKLKDARVVGAFVEGGYYYTPYHHKQTYFENPNLAKQIAGFNKIKMPYGLFTICRALSANQAKEEMYYFSFPVRKYSPKLGVWLQLNLCDNKETNDPIIARYISDLTRLGYKSKIGIICTKKALETFDWKKYQEDLYLCVIDHITNLDELNKLMDPKFFDIDGDSKDGENNKNNTNKQKQQKQ